MAKNVYVPPIGPKVTPGRAYQKGWERTFGCLPKKSQKKLLRLARRVEKSMRIACTPLPRIKAT